MIFRSCFPLHLDIFHVSKENAETITDCPPFLIPCFGACCPPGRTYCNSQRRECEPTASNRLLDSILVRPSDKDPSYSFEDPILQDVPAINSERTDIPDGKLWKYAIFLKKKVAYFNEVCKIMYRAITHSKGMVEQIYNKQFF